MSEVAMTPEMIAESDRKFDEIMGIGSKPKIEMEVDKLLERTGLTREQVSTDVEEQRTYAQTPRVNPATGWSDTESGASVGEDEPDLFPEPDPHWTEELKAEADAAKPVVPIETTANAIADQMVPEFGSVLKKYEPNAIAFGFPPAVDALITKAKLLPEQTSDLLKHFSSLFVLTASMRNRVAVIDVRDVDDLASIDEAKECHRILRDERLNAEKKKKLIKEPYLRPSQLIDGVFRIWMDEIGPIEKDAQAKALYAENLEKQRKETIRVGRLEKLKLFGADGADFDLANMTDEAFDLVYTGSVAAFNARKEAERLAEESRLEEQRKNEAERIRLAAENKRLEEQRAIDAARNAELQREADDERAKKEELEASIRKQDQERAAEEQRLAAAAEAKRLAPDKEKLVEFAQVIAEIQFPTVDAKFEPVIATVRAKLNAAIETLQRCTEKL